MAHLRGRPARYEKVGMSRNSPYTSPTKLKLLLMPVVVPPSTAAAAAAATTTALSDGRPYVTWQDKKYLLSMEVVMMQFVWYQSCMIPSTAYLFRPI
jgi:hypothetical protein